MPERHFTARDYVAAFKKIDPAPHQIRMLQVNYHAPHRNITATQLAKAMGYKNYNAANLHYGTLGKQVGKEFKIHPLLRGVGDLVGFDRSDGEWHWILKPEVAAAIERLGWIDPDTNTFPEELDLTQPIYEGAVTTVSVNAYERSSVAREKCILHHGCQCSVCDVVLADVYGVVALGFVHVHHVKPMAEVTARYRIDPIKDLRPVCPNCHAVIHLSKPPYSIKEAKRILRKSKTTGKG